MTLNEIVSSIRNHIADGLSGQVENTSYSIEQLEEEVIICRANLLKKYEIQPQMKLNKKYFYQSIDQIPIETVDVALEGKFSSGITRKGIYVPKIIATGSDDGIAFLGDANKRRSIKVYYDTDYVDHEYRPFTNRLPYAWLDTTLRSKDNGNIIYLYNFDKPNSPKYLSIIAILSDPRDHPLGLGEMTEFPCPAHLQEEIIKILTERYVRYYRMLNIPSLPNTQTDV